VRVIQNSYSLTHWWGKNSAILNVKKNVLIVTAVFLSATSPLCSEYDEHGEWESQSTTKFLVEKTLLGVCVLVCFMLLFCLHV
jgi:hypothetical protein